MRQRARAPQARNHWGRDQAARNKRLHRTLCLEVLENRVLPSGTPHLLKNVNPGTLGSSPGQIVQVGDTIFFAARDNNHGRELWKTDGTAAGTALVKDINPGRGSSYPEYLTNFNETLFFVANDGSNGT